MRAAAAGSAGGFSLAAKRSVGSVGSVLTTSRQAVAVASLGKGGNKSMHSSASSVSVISVAWYYIVYEIGSVADCLLAHVA